MSISKDLKRAIDAPGDLLLSGVPEGFDALSLADIARARGGLSVFVARDGSRAEAFQGALNFFAPEIGTMSFPAWDCLPYDRVGPSRGGRSRAHGDLEPPRARAEPRQASRSGGHGGGADAARAAARGGQGGGLLDPCRRAREHRRPGALLRGQRLSPRLHRLRPGRVRHPRRGDRRLPARRRRAGASRPVRRQPGVHPRLRSGDPALHAPAQDRRPAAGERGAARQKPRSTAFARGTSRRSARRATTRSMRRSARAAAARAWSTTCRCSSISWRPCSTTCPIAPWSGHRPSRQRSPARAVGPDRRCASRPQRDRAEDALPGARARSALPGRGRVGPASRRARPSGGSRPFQAEPGEGTIDLGARRGRTFAAERAQDSVNLFEATAEHARTLAKAGKRVIFASWTEGSSDRLSAMLADHGLKGVSPRQRLEPGAAPPTPRSHSARSSRWRTASRPTTSPSSPRPTSWAIAWRGPDASGAPPTSWPRRPRSRRATWWCTSTTASAATTD